MRFDDGTSNHTYANQEHYYQHLYFEVLDLLICEMNHRFYCNGIRVHTSDTFQKMYDSDLSFNGSPYTPAVTATWSC